MRPPDSGGGQLVTVPPGRPERLRAAADRLRRASASCLDTATVRGSAARDVDIVWTGSAAAAAKVDLSTLAARTGRVLPQLDAGGAALRGYADELEHAQRAQRLLQRRAEGVDEDHARAVAAAEAHVVDLAARRLAVHQADERRAAQRAGIAREGARIRADLSAAAERCRGILHRLAGSAHVAGAKLVEDLPMTSGLIAEATRPPVGRARVRPEQPWWQSALDAAAGGAEWTWNTMAVPLVNGAADVAEAALEHPEDIVGMGLGVGQIIIGAGGQVGGVALDSTGVGAVVGVPLHVASAALITSGVVTTTAATVQLGQHAADHDTMLLKEVKLKQGSRGLGGDPLPDSFRPSTVGSTWKGRIANNGNGEVWQRPEDICPPPKICGANSMRIADPETRSFTDRATGLETEIDYTYGYTRFYNAAGQPLRLDGRPGTEAETHIPIRPDGSYDLPRGWNPP